MNHGFFARDCNKHLGMLWIAVFVAWLATGAVFLTGTMHSREVDDRLQSRIESIETAVYKACGVR